jgi:hypothetical protein
MEIVPMVSKKEFEDYFFSHTNSETADHFDICTTTVFKWARSFGTKRKSNRFKDLTIDLTDRQRDILIGSMLGDGKLTKVADGSKEKHSRFGELHCVKQADYLVWKSRELELFGASLKHDIKNNGFLACEFRTISHPIFTEMERKWYARDNENKYIKIENKRVKKVPKDLCLSPLSLSVWYLDDGWRPKHDRQVYISTQGFSFDECDFLLSEIRRIGIEGCHVRSRKMPSGRLAPEIGIRARSSDDFLDMVSSQVKVECMNYKVKRAPHL